MDEEPIHTRIRLRDGVTVLRRSRSQLQVGLDPSVSVRLPESADVRRTLAVLAAHGRRSAADPAVLARLGGLVEPTDVQLEGRVDLREFGPAPVPGARSLLENCGVHLVDPTRERADVGLLVGVGEPARDLLDEWVVEGLPHLVARVSEGAGVVGPFVVPGRTACLRCIDAHRTEDDPRWPLLVEQRVQAAVEHRPAAHLLGLAVSWAVAEIVGHLAGTTPATTSATLRLPGSLAQAELVGWRPHTGCGCCWSELPPRFGSLTG